MRTKEAACAGWLFVAMLVGACGQGNSGDPPAASAAPSAGEPDSFLLFPNPQLQPDGSLQTNEASYAQAYYEAIDPANTKDSLAKWKAGQMALKVVNEAVQMHGGIGVTDELDVGLFLKRIRVAQACLGDADFHCERYAALELAHA